MKTNEIRKRFLDFFAKRGHAVVKSDSLIPAGDPTLLFTGAGMNQFKDYFLGIRKDLKRAASSQKCLRAGDLDSVGQTPYHHTFFEMLGNFSFGDYFKREAIEWGWEFLTKELKISPERLRISVHTKDDEAFKIWKDTIKIPEKWIDKRGDDSNFWPANAPKDGPNGPCGPCSEIYYDQGENYPGASKNTKWADDSSGRYAEIWNLVFTQFDRQSDGSLKPLAAKNIDTGAGLERLACMVQGKKVNYEIDLFEPMLKTMQQIFKGKIGPEGIKTLYTFVDHGRAAAFAITDGIFPSNEGRGYVIRKLIRRSVWRASAAGLHQPFLYKIVPAVIDAMGDQYPEIAQSQKNVTQMMEQEEKRFLETIESGGEVLSKMIAKVKTAKAKQIAGADVFLLYDTYGFPDELTKLIAVKEGLTIDQKGFDKLMNEQKERAKSKSKIADSIFVVDSGKQELASLPQSQFLGYEKLESAAKVVWTKSTNGGEVMVLDQTPFYPEGGGQVGDKGTISGDGFEFDVIDTQKKEKVILHLGKITKGKLKIGQVVKANVNTDLRNATKRNHTATHLLQAALKRILGDHVRQLGSLVNPEKLRFDFSHPKALTAEEIKKIEQEINRVILENALVQSKVQSYQDATKGGALAFFGEKYEEKVRVIDVPGFSKELCGGTHCERTGDIGIFVVTSESSVASGTRRIEAKTGLGGLAYLQSLQKTINDVSLAMKSSPDRLVEDVQKIQQNLKKAGQQKSSSAGLPTASELIQKSKPAGSVSVIAQNIQNAQLDDLRNIGDQLRQTAKQSVIALFSSQDDKVSLIVGLSKDLAQSKLDASQIAKRIAQTLDGSAGGRKDLAQGGGKNPAAIQQAIDELPGILKEVGK